jgi:hypothetical protein
MLSFFSYRSLYSSVGLLLGAMLCCAVQAQEPAQPTPLTAPVAAATLHGHVADPTGALIPQATVAILNSAGQTVKSATTDAVGGYTITGLAPNAYTVLVTATGFSPFNSKAITIAAGQSKRVDVSLAIEAAAQSVTVTDEATTVVSTEAGNNASALVIKGKDLDALSDDPDELSDELSALAGPSAGPNGGQIYIDGFTGGQLPPKSAIREIRINQNPFSAEFDKLGYGRIEILTKPGTDTLHGRVFSQGNVKQLNTGNPFTADVPGYYSYFVNSSLSGALGPKASFFLSVDWRDQANASIYSAQTGIDSSGNAIMTAGGVANPRTRINLSPRIDLQLGARNTLTARYQFYRDNQVNNLAGSKYLPSQATSSETYEHQLQLSDSFVINDRAVNETRVQYMHNSSNGSSASSAPTVQVSGYFTGGGSSAQSSHVVKDSLEFQNITTMSIRTQALKFGTRLRYTNERYASSQNFNGTFNFASLDAYQASTPTPNKLTYTYPSGASSFSAVAPQYNPDLFDAALFVQDDWKVNKFLTLSGGLRWESQNRVNDHSDWAPRVALAYALDGHKQGAQTKTVLRAGYGFFYDRFSIGNVLSAQQYNLSGNGLQQVVISNPTCYSASSLSDAVGGNPQSPNCGGSTSSTANSYVQIASRYKSPLTEQFGASIERQIAKSATATVSYLHSYGVHQLVTVDATSRDNGGVLPSGANIVNEQLPEAVFKQNQLIVNVNAKFTSRFSLNGFYSLNFANTNGAGGTASNSANLDQDYGRASFVSRNMLFLMSNYRGPWGVNFNPFLIAESGKPYNITLNNDLTGDNFFNNRPAWATASDCASSTGQYVQTSFGCFNTQPASGYTPIPVNLGNSPASVVMNLRISRAFGVGPKLSAKTSASQQQDGGAPPPPPSGGGPGGGGPGGGGPGGGGPGGFGSPRGPRPDQDSVARKYKLNFSVEAMNLFNNVNYAAPSGAIVPTKDADGNWGPGDQFGRSSSLYGGVFGASNAAVRRIQFQMGFSF